MMRIYANAMIQQSRVPVPVPSSSNYRGPLQPQLLEAIIMYRNPIPENYIYDGEICPYSITQFSSKIYPGS